MEAYNELQTKTRNQLQTMPLFNPITMLGTQGSNENQIQPTKVLFKQLKRLMQH